MRDELVDICISGLPEEQQPRARQSWVDGEWLRECETVKNAMYALDHEITAEHPATQEQLEQVREAAGILRKLANEVSK